MRSGKSFRVVLEACYAASSGTSSVIIIEHIDRLPHIIRMIKQVTGSLRDMRYYKNRVEFPNGYNVYIHSVSEIGNGCLIGRHSIKLVPDYEYYLLDDIQRYKFREALDRFHRDEYPIDADID